MKNIKAGDKVTIKYRDDTITATLLPNGVSLSDKGLVFYVMLDDYSVIEIPVKNIYDEEFMELYNDVHDILLSDKREHFLFRTRNGYKGASKKALEVIENKYYRRNFYDC